MKRFKGFIILGVVLFILGYLGFSAYVTIKFLPMMKEMSKVQSDIMKSADKQNNKEVLSKDVQGKNKGSGADATDVMTHEKLMEKVLSNMSPEKQKAYRELMNRQLNNTK